MLTLSPYKLNLKRQGAQKSNAHKKLIPLFIITIFFVLPFTVFCQDIHFTQFYEAPLLRNPALAGIFSGDLRVQTVFRNQWNSVTVPYQTASVNAEYKLPVGHSDDFLTMGIEMLYDKAGTVALTSTHVLPVLNYHKSLNKDRNMYLSLGFMGGIVQRRLDRSKLTTNNQFDGTGYNSGLSDGEIFPTNGYTYFDASTGLSLNTQIGANEDNNIYIGASYHHFNRPAKVAFYGNSKIEMIPKWVYSAGVRMSVTDYSYVTLYADYSKQGTSVETIGGMLYSYKLDDLEDPKYIFHAGGIMRWNDAIAPVLKMEFKPVAVTLSYDINVSKLKSASKGRGGFELSLSYQTYFDKYFSTKGLIFCPRF
jgi:type IX secretion system PorP/SprF family membrane protein